LKYLFNDPSDSIELNLNQIDLEAEGEKKKMKSGPRKGEEGGN
jgi:hypothetical protein